MHYEIPPGPKTIPMMAELNSGLLHRYHPEKQRFYHQKISYRVLSGSMDALSSFPSVYIGASPAGREIIAIDPKNSPFLEKSYQALLSLLKSHEELTPQKALRLIAAFLKQELFDPLLCTEDALEKFLFQWESSHPLKDFTPTEHAALIPVIPLEDFLIARVGVCRHLALATTYFISRLLEEKSILPQGKTFLVRDVIKTPFVQGGHAWSLYLSDDRKEQWHVDALWEIVNDLKEKEVLYQSYGKETIDRETERFKNVLF